MAVVETILSLPRSRTHEHNAVKWFALEYQVSSVFRPDAGPALPRMRSLCRMDALVRLVQPFRFVKLPFLLSFFFFSSFLFFLENSANLDRKDRDKLDSGFRYFCSFDHFALAICFPLLNRNANVKRAHASHTHKYPTYPFIFHPSYKSRPPRPLELIVHSENSLSPSWTTYLRQ